MAEYPVPVTVPIFNLENYPTTLNKNLTTSGSVVAGSLYFNTPYVIGSNWDASALQHIIYATDLTSLSAASFAGELSVYVSSLSSGKIGLVKVIVTRGSSTYPTVSASTAKVSNFTTLTVGSTGINNNLVVNVNPAAKMCYLYVGT